MVTFNTKISKGFRYIIWAVGLLSMGYLTFRDCFKLIRQYEEHKLVANVDLVDMSDEGIRIPNGTVCIHMNIFNLSYLKLLEPKWHQTVVDLIALKRADYRTTEFHQPYSKRQRLWKMMTNKRVPESVANFHTVQKELAYRLCTLMNVKMKFTDGILMKEYDVCKLVLEDQLPFSINPRNMVCFRIPFDLHTFTDSFLEPTNQSSFTKDEEDEMNFNVRSRQVFLVSFSPLAIRRAVPTDLYGDVEIEVNVFLPEIPMTYFEMYWDKLLRQSSKKPFRHVIVYPWDFGYARLSIFSVQMAIENKFTKINVEPNCVDIYNNTNCVANCFEETFATLCGCHRFLLHPFEENPSTPYCTRSHYVDCSIKDETSKIFGHDQYTQNTMYKCLDRCHICTMVNLEEVDLFNLYKMKDEEDRSDGFCKIYTKFHNVSRAMCETAIKDPKGAVPMVDNILGKIQENDTIFDFQNSTNVDWDDIFGRVVYAFGMKSFTYPQFNQVLLITEEGFFSQIGGILGLYLGFSGLACFLCLIKLMKTLKEKCRKRMTEEKVSPIHMEFASPIRRFTLPLITKQSPHFSDLQQIV